MILYTLLSVSLAAVCDNMLLLRYSFFFLLLILSMNVQVFVLFIRDFISRSLRHRHCFIVCVFFCLRHVGSVCSDGTNIVRYVRAAFHM